MFKGKHKKLIRFGFNVCELKKGKIDYVCKMSPTCVQRNATVRSVSQRKAAQDDREVN
ncbi:MAG: hypothetical protein ACOCQG_03015 [Candidatus Nanoarchaeia archaeon]